MSFGLTSAGLLPKGFEDIRQELIAALQNVLDANIRTDSKSVLGNVIAIVAAMGADIWLLIEAVYAARSPAGAGGAALDDLLQLLDKARTGESYSTARLTLGGTLGTVVFAGSVVKDDAGTRWLSAADATIGGGGTVTDVVFHPETPGPIVARAGTLAIIDTPISGWASATNPADATVGFPAQSDPTVRDAWDAFMRASFGSASDAIRSAILRLPDVVECVVLENDTPFTARDGMPPNTLEAVVRAGDDQQIRDAIWEAKPSGVQTAGNTAGTSLDRVGGSHAVRFTRPTDLPVYIIVDYEPDDGFPADGEDQIETAILAYGQLFRLGKDVLPWQIEQTIEVPNIRRLSLRVGLTAHPTSGAPIAVDVRQLAAFDSTRVTFNRLPSSR